MASNQSVGLPVMDEGKKINATAIIRLPFLRDAGGSYARFAKVGRDFLWFCLAWMLIVAVWEVGAWQGWLNPRILPPPSETIPYLFSGEASIGFGVHRIGLGQSILATLLRVAVGMLAGIVTSFLLAILVLETRFLSCLIMPLVQSLAPIAPVAWIPFTIAVIGIGGQAAMFIVFITVVGSMTLSLIAALRNVPVEYIRIAKNLGASRVRLWRKVFLPAIAGNVVTTIRMSFFGAWMAVLAGEMAGINSGLGYVIIVSQQMFNMKMVMVGIVTIGIIGFVVDRLLLACGRWIVWWER
ncbi:ABC transporter permease [Advenella sp. RU8]|uniref:ABC transporter permease n=1 Tax=Advenella sp. RU8 TaxID=3399575 RepID=UPI003AAAA864